MRPGGLSQHIYGELRVRPGEVLGPKSGGYVPIRLDNSEDPLNLPVLRDYSPVTGDIVLVATRGAQGYVIGALGTAPPGAPTLDPDNFDEGRPVEDPDHGSSTFVPTYRGTWRGGGWRDTLDLYQGDSSGTGLSYGVAYYGGTPTVLADGFNPAIGRGVSVTVRRLRAGSAEPAPATFRLLSGTTHLSLTPPPDQELDDWTGPALTVGELTTVPLPDAWANQLATGTAGGVGIYVPTDSPYVRLDGSLMDLRIDWTRE